MGQQTLLSRVFIYRGVPLWRDDRVLRAAAQIGSAILVISVLAFFIDNLQTAATNRGLSLAFDFLEVEAGFDIGESVIPYAPSQTFGYAFLVGILNTLKVALVGIVGATLLGTFLGVARLSSNWLVSKIASVYIELVRNVPVLVQLFIWYFAVFQTLPPVRESIEWPGPVYLSNRGIYLAWPLPSPTFPTWLIFLLAGVVLSIVARKVLSRIQIETSRPTYPLAIGILALFALPAAGWFLVGESPLVLDVPVFQRFNYEGGIHLTPEFGALLVGLVVYTASFIAEIVRAGIQSVPRGQVEAAKAVGLSGAQTLRLVVFPQALRLIIPPLISQYLNLTKNSSLAVAVGYADLFFVGRTIINQAGRAVPVFAMIMLIYLIMSLTYASIGNVYNRRVQIVER